MKTKVLAIFDVQAMAFQRPIFTPSNGFALRMVTDEVNRVAQDNLLNMHPEDFRLFELGEFDEVTGLFQCHSLPSLICDCVSLKR